MYRNRRIAVAITKLDPPTLVFIVPDLPDFIPGPSTTRLTLRPLSKNRGVVKLADLDANQIVTTRRVAISKANRAPLDLVGRDQFWPAKSLHQRGELPAEVAGVANPCVHAVSAGRDVLVRGIAGEKHATGTVTIRDQQVRRPRIGDQDFMVERRAGKCLQQRACRGVTGAGALGETRMQRPDVFVVLRNQRAVDRLIVPGDAPALQKIDPGRSKMGHEALHDARGAG